MSSNHHRDVNVSQFIANLNSLDPMDSVGNNGVSMAHNDEELSIFSNTNFFDFDVGRSTNIAATVDDLLMQQERQLQDPKGKFAQHHAESSSSGAGAGPSSSSPASGVSGSEVQMIPLDFSSLQQFSLATDLSLDHAAGSPDLAGAASVMKPIFNTDKPEPPKRSIQLEDLNIGASASNKRSRKNTLTSAASSSSASSSPSVGPMGDNDNDNESGVKLSAEEDKRRRNTAASARFRIKKKLREQEMERTSKELQTKIQSLENQVMQLEMENRWLKNLVVEKNEARDLSELLDMKKKIIGGEGIKTE